jgi:hypothetical protein
MPVAKNPKLAPKFMGERRGNSKSKQSEVILSMNSAPPKVTTQPKLASASATPEIIEPLPAMNKSAPKTPKAGLNPKSKLLMPLQDSMMRNANLHSGFRDLNPEYTKYRHKRTKAVADRWLNILSEDLRRQIKEKKRELFNKDMMVTSNLHKLTYTQIKNLSTTYRKDVIDITSVKNKKITHKVMNVLGDNRELQTDMAEAQWDLENERDRDAENERKFDNAIHKKNNALKHEAQQQQKNQLIKFRLFNISDNRKMYGDKYCWACERGLECKKHPPPDLQKKVETFLHEEQFHGNMETKQMAALSKLRIEQTIKLSGTARASDLFYAKKMAKERAEQDQIDAD